MKHASKLLVVTTMVGSLGLAGLGISRAHAADATSTVDTATTATTTTTTTPTRERGPNHADRLADMATEFNMSTADLQKELDAGKEMYQIAAEHGVTFATQKAQHLTELKAKLDDMVKVKYMTQAEADAAYNNAASNGMVGMGMGMGGGRHGR